MLRIKSQNLEDIIKNLPPAYNTKPEVDVNHGYANLPLKERTWDTSDWNDKPDQKTEQPSLNLAMQVANGNPGALTIIKHLMSINRQDVLQKMLEKNIIGPNVWTKFKDEHGNNVNSFINDIMNDKPQQQV